MKNLKVTAKKESLVVIWTEDYLRGVFRECEPGRLVVPRNRDGGNRGYAFIEVPPHLVQQAYNICRAHNLAVETARPRAGRMSPQELIKWWIRHGVELGREGVLATNIVRIYPDGTWELLDTRWDFSEEDKAYWDEVGRLFKQLPPWLFTKPAKPSGGR